MIKINTAARSIVYASIDMIMAINTWLYMSIKRAEKKSKLKVLN